jgi:hypothetical protein
MKKNLFKKFGRFIICVTKGIGDTIFPNITQSIKKTENNFPYDKKIEINYPRLISSITLWFVMMLIMYDKVKFSDVIEIINKLLSQIN